MRTLLAENYTTEFYPTGVYSGLDMAIRGVQNRLRNLERRREELTKQIFEDLREDAYVQAQITEEKYALKKLEHLIAEESRMS